MREIKNFLTNSLLTPLNLFKEQGFNRKVFLKNKITSNLENRQGHLMQQLKKSSITTARFFIATSI